MRLKGLIPSLFLLRSPFTKLSYASQSRNYVRRAMRVETDGSTGTVTFHPDEGSHSATVILMHGLGDSADGLSDLGENFSSTMPHVKFVLPTAPQMPVTLNGGMRMNAWYDIVGLDDRASESCGGIVESVSKITAIIEAEAALGLPYSRIALAGFSQGGALSLFTGLQLPAEKKLAGLLILSGYLPGASQFHFTPEFADVPVMHCHGEADPVVKLSWAQSTKVAITEKGLRNYELKTYPGVGHSISGHILMAGSKFLGTILPDDASFRLKGKEPKDMTSRELLKTIRALGLGQQALGLSEKHELVKLLEDYYASKAN